MVRRVTTTNLTEREYVILFDNAIFLAFLLYIYNQFHHLSGEKKRHRFTKKQFNEEGKRVKE